MASAENAWGVSGGHVHGGAPPKLQTGGGTSPRLLALGLAHSSLDQNLSYVAFSCLLLPVRLPALPHANSTKTKIGLF